MAKNNKLTVEALAIKVDTLTRQNLELRDNINQLGQAHNNAGVFLEQIRNILVRVKARLGGKEGRVCGLCLAHEGFEPMMLFPNQVYGKLCADCTAQFKMAQDKAKKLGDSMREPGA